MSSEQNPESERPDPLGSWRGKSRREKIRAEIEANRRGDYTVPTWVLALALVAMIAGVVALVLYARQV